MTNTIAPPTLEELNERIVAIEDLRNTWRDLPSKTPFDLELYCLYAVRDGFIVLPKALLDFFTWAMNEGPFDGCSLDGGDVQDKAEKLGLIVSEKYDPEVHGERCDFEEGDNIYVFSPNLTGIPVPTQSPWMDIETAPKDVELLLGWWRSGLERKWEYASGLAGSTKGGWLHGQATHWMPIPAPPTHNSPPDVSTSHNHGEGDPSVMPDSSGGEQ